MSGNRDPLFLNVAFQHRDVRGAFDGIQDSHFSLLVSSQCTPNQHRRISWTTGAKSLVTNIDMDGRGHSLLQEAALLEKAGS
jgi:hypothetical protein